MHVSAPHRASPSLQAIRAQLKFGKRCWSPVLRHEQCGIKQRFSTLFKVKIFHLTYATCPYKGGVENARARDLQRMSNFSFFSFRFYFDLFFKLII
eukprot:sb/3479153/